MMTLMVITKKNKKKNYYEIIVGARICKDDDYADKHDGENKRLYKNSLITHLMVVLNLCR